MADEVTERAQLLELLAKCDAMIDQIKAENATRAETGRALLGQAQDLRATIQRKIGHQS
jgi:hypothetical protein